MKDTDAEVDIEEVKREIDHLRWEMHNRILSPSEARRLSDLYGLYYSVVPLPPTE